MLSLDTIYGHKLLTGSTAAADDDDDAENEMKAPIKGEWSYF